MSSPSEVMAPSTSRLPAWDRPRLAALADGMLTAVRPFASPGHALLRLPGAVGGYGREVDALEGFARTFLLAGFRLAGEDGRDPLGLAEFYAAGLDAGTDPASPERWVRLDEHPQAKVEAASLALVLDMTRPWLWDRLDPQVQERVVAYLSHAVGDDTYPRINWVWFRLLVQTFLRSVGGPSSTQEMAEDLATHDTFVRADGWLADGAERSYDHYSGWALHLFPTLWARMRGAEDLAAGRREGDRAALGRFLLDAVRLVGGDGSPLVQGRSLTYRFAAAAPFWAGAMAEVDEVSPGLLRRAATRMVAHFETSGAFDAHGLLGIGWHGPWPALAQSYSGPGSPYWASKGLLGLALPAGHPVWTSAEEPLPVERADEVWAARAPGWLVSGTVADGVVRVVNHGTDHALPGAQVGDSPLYARLGYSTATSPLLDRAGWSDPLEQGAVLLDEAGRASHRAGMRTLDLRVRDGGAAAVGVAASTGEVRWLDPAPTQKHHGSGLEGEVETAGTMTVVSLVRGPWELRLVRVEETRQDPARLRLRVGGWALSGEDDELEVAVGGDDVGVRVATPALRACVLPLVVPGPGATPASRAGVRVGTTCREDASPLGPVSVVGWVEHPVVPGAWTATLVGLSGAPGPEAATGPLRLVASPDGTLTVGLTWPDGTRTDTEVLTEHPGEAPLPPGDDDEPDDGLDR